jgi:hypothetical protein
VPSSSGAEESDQQREAEAYNYNIYMMVGTPYLLLAGLAFYVYRGLRRKHLAQLAASSPSVSEAADAGSFHSGAESSSD